MILPDTFSALGDAVGQRLTQGEIESVADLLDYASGLVAEFCTDDPNAADHLEALADALREGERRYR